MTTKHTPGPWKILADPVHAGKHPLHDCRFIATADAEFENDFDCLEAGELICSLRDSENQKANAKLIAAAPDLFEVAQMAASSIKVDQLALMSAARAAIRKATGN